jgi:hypothetical protein
MKVFRQPLLLVCAFLLVLSEGGWESPVEASCGSASCFVVIGSQQQVAPSGVLTMNLTYTYTPNGVPPDGANAIPYANQELHTLTLANTQVKSLSTIVQTETLDLNYGLTDRIGLQLSVPYRNIKSDGQFGTGTVSHFTNHGIGDVLAKVKYNLLPTLRSMVVLEFGVYFPTGSIDSRGQGGQLAESTLQNGRGAFGLQPSFYQTYEILPHRLNQFLQGGYRYSFANEDGYQFGQEYLLNGGFNLVTLPWLVLTQQVNYRYKTMDTIESSLYQFIDSPINRAVLIDGNVLDRPVPTTNSTYVAYSTGINVNLWDFCQAYFVAQIPIYRDFSGNLQQETSYLFGMTKYFATPPLIKS